MLEKLNDLDSRWMYLALVIALVIPIIKPVGMPISINKDLTQRAYDYVETLKPDDIVMFDIAYAASSDTELTPMVMAVMEQMARLDLKLLVAGQFESGLYFTKEKIAKKAEELGWAYGTDWVNIGFKAGGTATWRAIGADFWSGAMGVDIDQTPFEQLPLMDRIKTLNPNDISLIIIYESGSPGMETWMTYFPEIPLIKASVAVEVASAARYIPTGQLKGIIPGMRGAAEYEKLILKTGVATQLMDAQSLSSLVILGLVVLGNVAHFGEKRRAGKFKGAN